MPEFDPRAFPPTVVMFMTLPISNFDGTMDIDTETGTCFDTLAGAISSASSEVEDHGETVVVYECRPVKHVVRLPTVEVRDVPT